MYGYLETDVFPFLSRRLCVAVYLHELFALHATDTKMWDAKQFRSFSLNWKWLARGVNKHGKMIYWSDGRLS